MIEAVSVKNFRSVLWVEIKGLGRLNVILGPNSVGKTNLIESLAVLGAAASGDLSIDSLRSRGVRTGWKFLSFFAQPEDKIALGAVGDNGMSYQVELTESSSGLLYHRETLQSGDGNVIVHREADTYMYRKRQERVSLCEGVIPIIRSRLRKKEDRFIERLSKFRVYHFSGQLDVDESETLDVLMYILGHDVLKHLQKELLGLGYDIFVTGGGSEKRLSVVNIETGNKMPVSSLGEGVVSILRSLIPCLLPEYFPPSFAVDGFGQGLHPRTAAKAVIMTGEALVATPGSQIFLTTHAPDVLDGAVATESKLIFINHRDVDRGVLGELSVTDSVQIREILGELESPEQVSTLFWEGWFGGVPPVFFG